MCELLAMSSRLPANLNFSLTEFSRHGGLSGPHRDGWGIAYAMAGDFRIIKEAAPASDSQCVQYLQTHHFDSHLAISHIRKASLPKTVSFENTHPFDREFGGRRFVFAHNGHLPGVQALGSGALGSGALGSGALGSGVLGSGAPPRFRPIGQTDSEAAFCLIMNDLATRVAGGGDYRPQLLHQALTELSPRLIKLGRCNFLITDGQFLFAHGDNSLHAVTRHCDIGTDLPASRQMESPPTATEVVSSDSLTLRLRGEQSQAVSIIATVPLTTSEHWQPFKRGELRVYHAGAEIQGGELV